MTAEVIQFVPGLKPIVRCEQTGNMVGTDTRPVDRPCLCRNCVEARPIPKWPDSGDCA